MAATASSAMPISNAPMPSTVVIEESVPVPGSGVFRSTVVVVAATVVVGALPPD